MRRGTVKRSISFFGKGLALGAAFCLLLTGCGKGATADRPNTLRYGELSFVDHAVETGTVCENARYSLSWDAETMQVSITDKTTGAVYGTTPAAARTPRQDAEGNVIANNPQVDSPVIVTYYDKKTLMESTALAKTEAIDDDAVVTQRMKTGLRVIYRFTLSEFTVPVEYTLSDDCFNITVHPEQISDNGVNYVTGVSLAPFLCGLQNGASDSYLFYPDGCGALIRPTAYSQTGSQGKAHVYGEDQTVYAYHMVSYTRQIHLPVFGSKQGSNAVLGVITSGAEQASIEWNVGSKTIGYSSVYPSFRIRGYNLIEAPEGYAGTAFEVPVFDNFVTETPLRVSYYTLSGDDANYIGMANTYRDYLLQNELLDKGESTEPALAVRMLGAAQKRAYTFGVPHTVLEPLTTLKQARSIAEALRGTVDGNILIDLVGFGRSGLDPGRVGGGFTLASALGGKRDARALTDYCAQNDISLFLDFDLIAFSDSGGGFSALRDGAKIPSGQTAYLTGYDTVTRKPSGVRYEMLTRDRLADAVEKAVAAATKRTIPGVSFGSLSNTMYSDYGSNLPLTEQMATQTAALLRQADESASVCSVTANGYAAAVSDHVLEVPVTSSNYDILDCDIPFYQIVFKGYVSMSGPSFNLAADARQVLLRCVESGISPGCTLLEDAGTELLASPYAALYGAAFSGLRDSLAETVGDVSKAVERVAGAQIISHTVEPSGLRVTDFSNGVRIAVNETDAPLSFGGRSVAAHDFAVEEGTR